MRVPATIAGGVVALALAAPAMGLQNHPAPGAPGTGRSKGPPSSLANLDRTGYQLVNRFTHDVQTRNAQDLNVLLAPSWTFQRATGAWEDKAGFIADITPVASYAIATSVSAYFHGALTVRWEVALSETDASVPAGTPVVPRLSTFAWTPRGWRMTSHANFVIR